MVTGFVPEVALCCTGPARSQAVQVLLVPSSHRLEVLHTLLADPYLVLYHYHSNLEAVGRAYPLDLRASLVRLLEDTRLFHLEGNRHVHLFPRSQELIGSSSWCCWILGAATHPLVGCCHTDLVVVKNYMDPAGLGARFHSQSNQSRLGSKVLGRPC